MLSKGNLKRIRFVSTLTATGFTLSILNTQTLTANSMSHNLSVIAITMWFLFLACFFAFKIVQTHRSKSKAGYSGLIFGSLKWLLIVSIITLLMVGFLSESEIAYNPHLNNSLVIASQAALSLPLFVALTTLVQLDHSYTRSYGVSFGRVYIFSLIGAAIAVVIHKTIQFDNIYMHSAVIILLMVGATHSSRTMLLSEGARNEK